MGSWARDGPPTGCDAVRTVPDMDGDGLLNTEEAAIGTDALNPDTDGDGFSDGVELATGSDPLDPLSTPQPLVPSLSPLALATLCTLLALAGTRRLRG